MRDIEDAVGVGWRCKRLTTPGTPRQRAEITAFLDCLQTTEGSLIFYTDSEILCKRLAQQEVPHHGIQEGAWRLVEENTAENGYQRGSWSASVPHRESHV
eukprot:3023035-Pyramimonas_sp.AAC.1